MRASRVGARDNDLAVPTYVARSRAFHSHSRFDRNSNWRGNVSVFNVVSIWNTLTPASTSTLPIRQLLLCSSLRCWSMKL